MLTTTNAEMKTLTRHSESISWRHQTPGSDRELCHSPIGDSTPRSGDHDDVSGSGHGSYEIDAP
jgi:hypothetical protein